MMDRFNSRSILVTGGSNGIGRATVLEASSHFGTVYFTYNHDRAGALQLRDELESFGTEAVAIHMDILDPRSVEAAAFRAVESAGGIDSLVLNAGLSSRATLSELDRETVIGMCDATIWSAISLTQAAIPAMRDQGFGRIVVVTSSVVAGGVGFLTSSPIYTSVKAGLGGLVRNLAVTAGPLGITANAVAPGWIDTDRHLQNAPDASRRIAIERIPVGRTGSPSDVAAAIGFLLTERAGYINGATLPVNGGLYLS